MYRKLTSNSFLSKKKACKNTNAKNLNNCGEGVGLACLSKVSNRATLLVACDTGVSSSRRARYRRPVKGVSGHARPLCKCIFSNASGIFYLL